MMTKGAQPHSKHSLHQPTGMSVKWGRNGACSMVAGFPFNPPTPQAHAGLFSPGGREGEKDWGGGVKTPPALPTRGSGKFEAIRRRCWMSCIQARITPASLLRITSPYECVRIARIKCHTVPVQQTFSCIYVFIYIYIYT